MHQKSYARLRGLAAVAVLSLVCLCAVPAAQAADEAAGNASHGGDVVFLGFDGTAQDYYPYAGWRHHFSGSVLDDGFLLRVFGFYAPYSYKTPAVAGGNVDGKAAAFDVMVGYQKVLQSFLLRGFVGPEFENNSLSPNNPADKTRGSDAGAKVQGELETTYNSPFYGSAIGSFGTAKRRYWTRLRAGYDFQSLIIGPEGLALGNQSFDEQRVGAFLTVKNVGPVWLSFALGYSRKDANHGGDSPYGTIEVSTTF